MSKNSAIIKATRIRIAQSSVSLLRCGKGIIIKY